MSLSLSRKPQLNPAQKIAVEHRDGQLVVFAGAGSGKTRVIIQRIQRMIDSGISPSNIVAVTFTNRAAREMKARLNEISSRKKIRGITMCTFHSLGNRILKKEIERLGSYRVPFSILSQDDAIGLLADIYSRMKLDSSDVKNDGIAFRISLCKNTGANPEKFVETMSSAEDANRFIEIYRRYHESLAALNAVDFDDLILLPLRIFRQHPDALEQFHKRYKYFLVDEFQDTNPSQYDLLRLLTGSSGNICVVGDDDQSIYGWRGADVNIILDFKNDFPQAETTMLETNYRSAGNILAAANAVIQNNAHRAAKTLRAAKTPGEKIVHITAGDETDEAETTATRIQDLMRDFGKKPGDFAILYRTNFQSRAFEEELRKREIPCHVVGGYRFFDRREVKDIIAYLRVMANPKNEISLKRIINRPRRSIGEAAIRHIHNFIRNHEEDEEAPYFYSALKLYAEDANLIPEIRGEAASALPDFLHMIEKYRKEFISSRRPSYVLNKLLNEINFEAEFIREGNEEKIVRARMLNLSEVTNMLAYFEENEESSGDSPLLYDFLSQISMMQADNEEENPAGRVSLLTLHLAKGLEYPVVFLAGMEEGIFPGRRSLEESTNPEATLQEERRLFYVGITRAMERLFITSCSRRKRFGETVDCEPSRFLDELPDELVIREISSAEDPEHPDNPGTSLLAGLEAL